MYDIMTINICQCDDFFSPEKSCRTPHEEFQTFQEWKTKNQNQNRTRGRNDQSNVPRATRCY